MSRRVFCGIVKLLQAKDEFNHNKPVNQADRGRMESC